MQKLYIEQVDLSNRPEVLSEIEKLNCKTILDIGGTWNCWLGDKVTHMFDMFDPNSNMGMTHNSDKKITWFKGDINNYEDWIELLLYTEENGKFDFVNCTHTLEDLAYPITALKLMPRIAKAGFIAVPSKYWELDRRQIFRGGHHHRWIFDIDKNILTLYPKINLIEYMNAYNTEYESKIKPNNYTELRMLWWDDLEFNIINDDYLGPTFEDVVNMYEYLIQDK